MPLWKRFQEELLPEWRKECVDYRTLKNRAESLVGSEHSAVHQEQQREQLQQLFSTEMNRISNLYSKQERKLCKFFCSIEARIDSMVLKLDIDPEAYLARFGGNAAILQEEAHRMVPRATMAFLAHVDALRSFALLNTLAVVHIADRHCTKELRASVLDRLHEEAFFHCHRLASLVDEIGVTLSRFFGACFPSFGEFASPETPWTARARDSSSPSSAEHSPRNCRSAPITAPNSNNSGSDGAASTRRGDVEALCSWMNQQKRLPAWVFRHGWAPGDVDRWGFGDARAVQVRPLMPAFALHLHAALAALNMGHLSPHLPGIPAHPPAMPQPCPIRAAAAELAVRGAEAYNDHTWHEGSRHAPPTPSGPGGAEEGGAGSREREAEQESPAGNRAGEEAPRGGGSGGEEGGKGGYAWEREREARSGALRLIRSCRNLVALAIRAEEAREL